MTEHLSPGDRAKFAAAKRASALVETGMRVGLGTGSTAAFLVRCLGDRVREEGLSIQGVPTSSRTAHLAREVGIEVFTLEDLPQLDLTIDGADEFDPDLNLIKGGGGALLQEKIVAMASNKMVVITDDSKKVDTLGAFALPVEVLKFGWQTSHELIKNRLEALGLGDKPIARRMSGETPYFTDEGNYILDLQLGRIADAPQLALRLNQIPGVVENGLFIAICERVIIGYNDGTTSEQSRPVG
ncbi:MAG: ribose-5-phosphate isomerase RpiA [Paracoccaceae bacterium]|nr:ribose-5-phosphate isomerase RpiA [Paracoccaceae bacterium]